MSFRPLSLKARRAGLSGLIFLAGVALVHAQDKRPRPVEVIPMPTAMAGTNFNQPQSSDAKNFEDLFPGAQSFRPGNAGPGPQATMPLFRSSQPDQQEQDRLDRRKNWVFAMPEDLDPAKQAEETFGIKQYDKDGAEKKPTTAMQRYWEHLNGKDPQSATNQLNDLDSDSSNRETNSITYDHRLNEDARVFDSPFDAHPSPGVFEQSRPKGFSDVFGTDTDANTPSPESIRAQELQAAHIENFKQLWNIDQPAAAAASALPSMGNPSASATISLPGLPPVFGTANATVHGNPAPIAPVSYGTTPTSGRLSPPAPDFTAPQRRF